MTRVCGLKLTHDAAVAVIEDGRLLFSTEVEKLDNNARYSKMDSMATASGVLHSEGLTWSDMDLVVVDGWKHGRVLEPWNLDVAGYHEHDPPHIVKGLLTWPALTNGPTVTFKSLTHNAGHIYGTYCASPCAATQQPAAVLVWDGGQGPRLYRVDPRAANPVQFVTALFSFYGIIYGIMGYYFGPYARPEVARIMRMALMRGGTPPVYFGGYETPGKLMSYLALGRPSEELSNVMKNVYREIGGTFGARVPLEHRQDGAFEHMFMQRLLTRVPHGVTDADVIATLHTFLGDLLLANARAQVAPGEHLLFTGGSALNIKWNSALRNSGHFASVWVPPFPNDSGSALGAAAAGALEMGLGWALDWSVYAGPRLGAAVPPGRSSWDGAPCTAADLGRALHAQPDPVVFLSGRAEIGPRALGARSILAPATDPAMKGRLNAMKRREAFRPVAPICLEEHAQNIFTPGTPDPYMLFDHVMRAEWRDLLPAVLHLDGTARLQTVRDGPAVTEVLRAYHAASGVPLLCNTSANLNGSGFFPDAGSAMAWDGCSRVWADGTLWTRRAE